MEQQHQHQQQQHICETKSVAGEQKLYCDGSFHEAVGTVLLIAEFFALMPVRGVTDADWKNLSFNWLSARTFYSLAFIAGLLFDLSLTIYKVLNGPITFDAIEPIIFRTSIVIIVMNMLKLAQTWPDIIREWHEVESDLAPFDNEADKRRLSYRIRLVTYVAMLLSFVEHLMSVISVVAYGNRCPVAKEPIKNFLIITNSVLFQFFSYSIWIGIIGKLENILCTFIWNYMDVFVMITGIALTSKFQQFNYNLFKFKGMQMNSAFWEDQRVKYKNLSLLSEKMDNKIALITIISFSNNLYFICVQLLKSLNKMPSLALVAYFYYSLLFLFARTLAVSLYAAGVHDESRKPLRVLRSVPPESWCVEVKRFAQELTTDVVALSGMKFFHLTRKLVLTVTGTIVTYVLVLIQFHEKVELWKCDGVKIS